jgi:hypothetical protein
MCKLNMVMMMVEDVSWIDSLTVLETVIILTVEITALLYMSCFTKYHYKVI